MTNWIRWAGLGVEWRGEERREEGEDGHLSLAFSMTV
jgi:hypothetical protein